MEKPDDFFRDPFHSIAAACYAIVGAETGRWPPDSETVRQMAYAEYEKELKNGGISGRVRPNDATGGDRA